MSLLSSSQPVNISEALKARQAIRIGLATLALTVALTLTCIYLAVQNPVWQMWAILGTSAMLTIAAGIGVWMGRQGRLQTGFRLIIVATLIAIIISPLFLEGLGLISGLGGVLIVLILSPQALSQREINWMFITGVGTAVVAGVIDVLGPSNRLSPAALLFIIPVLIGLIAVISGVLIVRQFRAYSLSTKLMISFIAMSVVSVTAIAFLSSDASRTALTREVGAGLKRLAESQALVVGNLLDRQVDALQTLALNRNLQDSVNALNSVYLNNEPDAIQAKLEDLDRDWQAADDDDPLIRSRINNLLSQVELAQFKANFPDHTEVFITDRYGALIAATGRTSDYYQADEAWWQAAYNNGQGAVYIGSPEFDESTQILGNIIAVPLYVQGSDSVVGILRSTYNAVALLNILSVAEPGETGKVELYLPGGVQLKPGFNRPQLADEFSSTALAQALNSNVDYIEFIHNGIPTFASAAPVTDITNDPLIANLGWILVISQDQEEILAPVKTQEELIQLLGLSIIAISGAAAAGLAHFLARPILRLTDTAQQVASGNLAIQATTETKDEIGTLATVFNSMTNRLRQTIDTLEEQVTDRTRQLETVVVISQRLTGILDLNDLLRQVVTITKETFNYYHVHIYLLDEQGETLNLAEGYGEAGAEMKRHGHAIPLAAPKSLVARAAREGKVVTVENVRLDPAWLPNSLLPETYAEMAVPVMLGYEVVGVLDVQSEKVGGLTPDDETALQALANQVANAVHNARLFSKTQQALQEAQKLQRLYTGQAWQQFNSSRTTKDYEFRQSTLPPLQSIMTPEAQAALQNERTIKIQDGALDINNGQEQAVSPSQPSIVQPPDDAPATGGAALATPLKLRDQIIGVLGVREEGSNRRWTEDEIILIEAVSEQMSLAIENARLFEEGQRSAWRDQVISESTAKVWSSAEIEEVMKAAVAQLGDKLQASEVVIRLGTQAELVQE
ncbi:MAG: hypothetical protein Fur0044_33580 [Anaerolineae bacterium]